MNPIDLIKSKIESVLADLHLVFVNLKSCELLSSKEGNNLYSKSPSFVSSYLYSAWTTNVLIMANLFDKNEKRLSLYKLVNIIERNKDSIEEYNENLKKSEPAWAFAQRDDIINYCVQWRKTIDNFKGEITKKIYAIRHNICAHKSNSFNNNQIKNNSFLIEDFAILVSDVFELVNNMYSDIFHCAYFNDDVEDSDLSRTLRIINKSF